MGRVVVIGSCNVDFVMEVPHMPAIGETVLADSVRANYGGKGANQAAAIAKLGGSAAVIGCVGNDEHGVALVALLNDYGVDTSGIERAADVQTGTAYIKVDRNGDKSLVITRGANNRVTPELIDRHAGLLDGASLCVIQLEVPLEAVYHTAKICKERGIRLILNPAPATELDFERLRGTWMIAPNERELNLLASSQEGPVAKTRELLGRGFENALSALGQNGCQLVNANCEKVYEAYHEIPIVDQTAAGDSFIGGLAFALASGKELEQAISLALKATAITTSRFGALQALPTWEELRPLL